MYQSVFGVKCVHTCIWYLTKSFCVVLIVKLDRKSNSSIMFKPCMHLLHPPPPAPRGLLEPVGNNDDHKLDACLWSLLPLLCTQTKCIVQVHGPLWLHLFVQNVHSYRNLTVKFITGLTRVTESSKLAGSDYSRGKLLAVLQKVKLRNCSEVKNTLLSEALEVWIFTHQYD